MAKRAERLLLLIPLSKRRANYTGCGPTVAGFVRICLRTDELRSLSSFARSKQFHENLGWMQGAWAFAAVDLSEPEALVKPFVVETH